MHDPRFFPLTPGPSPRNTGARGAKPTTIASLVVLVLIAASRTAESAAPDYRRDVEPIFKQYCNGCHNATDREGKLSLERFDDLLRGGAGGVIVVPGRSELSRLLLVLDGREKPIMPPEGNERPTPAEVSKLKQWIEAGAKGPTGQAPDPTILQTPKIKLSAKPRDPITAVAANPTSGGPIAIASYGAVRLVALDDRAVSRTLSPIRGNVVDVEFSRDGKLLATAAGEPGVFGEAQLWSVADGKLLRTFTAHRDSLYAVALSPDGKMLATGSYDQTIQLWDAETGRELRTLSGHNGAVYDLAFHPQGKILASAGADRTVKLWDVATGTRLDTLGQPTKEQSAVAFSPDGRTLVAAGADNRLRAWRVGPGAKENTNPLTTTRFAHEGPVLKLVYSADGKTIASSGEDRTIRLWDAAGLVERQSLERQSDWAPGLALTADGKSLVVGRMDGTYAVYETATGNLVPPAKPELAGVVPRGIERGKTATVRLTGKHLAGVTQAVLRDTAGRPVRGQVRLVADGRSPTTLAVELSPEAKLPRGGYQLVVRSPGGESNVLPLQIDDLPQLAETETNNGAMLPTVPLNAGYWGVCGLPGDVDQYRVVGKKGEALVCRLEARAFDSKLDGFLTILDPDGETAVAVNDFDGDRDPLAVYRLPVDGIYTIRVNDQSMQGSPEHFYRLTVGTFPLATGVFPATVAVGRETKLELTGFNLLKNAAVAVHPKKPGETAVPLDEETYRTAKRLLVRAAEDRETIEREPNDVPEKAVPVTLPAHVSGRIFAGGPQAEADVDLFRFESKRGQSWIIETEAARRGWPTDTKIEVLDAAGRPVPRVLLQAVRDSYITFRSINSIEDDVRLFGWEEMQLNQYVYFAGDVAKLFRMPQGPDSGFRLYKSGDKRRGYFDTWASAHALDEPAYIVEPHPIGTKLVNNGLPVFTLNYANDDDALRRFGSDSRLTFTAPADGAYLVRVADSRGFGGDRYQYRLTIREPRPDFVVKLDRPAPSVAPGGGTVLTFNVDRQDGFEEEITIDAVGIPAGYSLSTPIRIEAGHDAAQAVLNATADAKPLPAEAWSGVKWTARAALSEATVERPLDGVKSVTLAAPPQVVVSLEPAEITIAPGTTISARLKIDRRDVKDRVLFDVLNLPHGVIVDNIGLNGILIPEGQSEREIFLTCYDWVPETERTFFAQAKTTRPESSRPVTLKVRHPSPLARADDASKSVKLRPVPEQK
jgi:WD40 repeat protein